MEEGGEDTGTEKEKNVVGGGEERKNKTDTMRLGTHKGWVGVRWKEWRSGNKGTRISESTDQLLGVNFFVWF